MSGDNPYQPPTASDEVSRPHEGSRPAPEFAQPLAIASVVLLPAVLYFHRRIIDFFDDRSLGLQVYVGLSIFAALVGVVGGTVALLATVGTPARGTRVAAVFGILVGTSLLAMVVYAHLSG